MSVLIAGASGNLGKALVPVFSARGRDVVALVRPSSRSRIEPLVAFTKKVVSAEVTEPELSAGVFEGVDEVVSAIGITRQRDGLTHEQVDFAANLNLLRAAERGGVRRFVYVSVVGADKDVDVPGLRAKYRFEKALIESSLEWQIVRPSGFFSDVRDVWQMALKGRVHLFGDGRSRISPIHTEDLAEAIADLLEAAPGALVSIGGPEDFSWNEVAELCFKVAGKTCRIRHWPEWVLRVLLAALRVLSAPTYASLSFLGHVMTTDTTAPNYGCHSLEEFLRKQ